MFQKKYVKLGMAMALCGMASMAMAQSIAEKAFIRTLNSKPSDLSNDSRFARNRAKTMERAYLTSGFWGSGHKAANMLAKPGVIESGGASIRIHNYESAQPYIQPLGAPYADQPGAVALASPDTKEQCAAAVHWAADYNNVNAFVNAYTADHPDANPQGYSNALLDYVTLNCNW